MRSPMRNGAYTIRNMPKTDMVSKRKDHTGNMFIRAVMIKNETRCESTLVRLIVNATRTAQDEPVILHERPRTRSS